MWLQAFLPSANHVGFNFEEIVKGITVQSARNIGLQNVMVLPQRSAVTLNKVMCTMTGHGDSTLIFKYIDGINTLCKRANKCICTLAIVVFWYSFW